MTLLIGALMIAPLPASSEPSTMGLIKQHVIEAKLKETANLNSELEDLNDALEAAERERKQALWIGLTAAGFAFLSLNVALAAGMPAYRLIMGSVPAVDLLDQWVAGSTAARNTGFVLTAAATAISGQQIVLVCLNSREIRETRKAIQKTQVRREAAERAFEILLETL